MKATIPRVVIGGLLLVTCLVAPVQALEYVKDEAGMVDGQRFASNVRLI